MAGDLRALLEQYADNAETMREKGDYFERLAVAFINHDRGMQQEYEQAWLYADWAKEHGHDARDTGIDAVAKIRETGGYCAIQCKFYRPGYRIQKKDIDSFLSASQTRQFESGIVIETSAMPWSANADAALNDLRNPVNIIDYHRLEQSPINWDKWRFDNDAEIEVEEIKQLYQHQQDALNAVKAGLRDDDRGKLIMACGTGKTFTGLRIAETLAGKGKSVLVLVPSLALMSQTIREWTIDSIAPLRSFAVCSDSQVGKRARHGQDDIAEMELHDLDYPATTDAKILAGKAKAAAPERMTVFFATYHSIQVLSDAQLQYGLPEFDLIICDEAHRTTGATLAGEDESHFVKVHNQDIIRGKKRLYMTATPRVYGEAARAAADEHAAELASMDDEEKFGKTLFTLNFGWAVENGFLTDYKVLVLAVDEQLISGGLVNRLADANSELKLDDATKIIGCYKALTKAGLKDELSHDRHPMQRALAFCRDIKSSKLITSEFSAVVDEYLASDEGSNSMGDVAPLPCALDHVDGTYNAKERNRLLDWLKNSHGDAACRILSNARCLSEGVDVPALDAILFMHPRKSQIDVVQSVGRVMRKAKDKQLGYVILPIGVPAGMEPSQALNDNERYKVIWQILNALRSHDERLDADINKARYGEDISGRIEIVAVSEQLPQRNEAKTGGSGIGQGGGDDERTGDSSPQTGNAQGAFIFDDLTHAIMAKIVKKCGTRDYWADWANDIAKIAEKHIIRITALVKKPDSKERAAFEEFLKEIRDDLNPAISESETIEMLAQHLITRPVFDALFEGYDFAQSNPVSLALQKVLETLDEHHIDKEADSLQKFYDSVKRRAAGIKSADAKQKIIIELYDKFFRNAFPKMTERLGIVYTPVEVVDFIIHSVNEVLRDEFGKTLGSKGVHILDPFTGTGSFITRMLQSGLIQPDELPHKYAHEIHANELVLLAYYIAAVNIEAAYHDLAGGDYAPFPGICLTDTFQLYEGNKDLYSDILADNSSRLARQKSLTDIRVIMGNPPYSVGQGSANDNAQNVKYPNLDKSISESYAARTDATNKNALYDSYIRAIRWASDRLGDEGVMGFVTNAGWIEGNSTQGLRKCLVDEFASLYIFHLRGNQRTQGEQSRKEGGKIFGSGSRAPIAISIFVKNPNSKKQGQIYFHDIGNYLDRDEKLKITKKFGALSGIAKQAGWQAITPDDHGDWLNQRDDSFENHIAMGDKKGNENIMVFKNYSRGVATARDAWAYNYSAKNLSDNIQAMIDSYNRQLTDFNASHGELKTTKARAAKLDKFIDNDPKKISWTVSLKKDLANNHSLKFHAQNTTASLYRPFIRQYLYFDRKLNERVYQMPRIYPHGVPENKTICVAGVGSQTFSVYMTNILPCLDMISKGQCFPLYLYSQSENNGDRLALGDDQTLQRQDGISDAGLAHFCAAYPGETITKDDLFHYIYGLLHSPDYRTRFADNLSKEMPRIPVVKQAADFWHFVQAGRDLAALHIDYDSVEPYPVTFKQGDLRLAKIDNPTEFYRVKKMKYGKIRNADGKLENDKSTIIYNGNITLTNIPLAAYDYIVNGKSAIDWVVERQCLKTDKKSGIVNDANAFANETMGDPAYPLHLLQRVITVSMETMAIVNALPKMEID